MDTLFKRAAAGFGFSKGEPSLRSVKLLDFGHATTPRKGIHMNVNGPAGPLRTIPDF